MAHAPQLLSETRLQEELTRRADRMRLSIAAKIPASLQSIVSPEDILQEVWITAFHKREEFRQNRPDALTRWINTTLERKVIDACRAARAERRGGGRDGRNVPIAVGSFVELFDRLAAGQRTPSREVSAKEAADAVRVALGSLPDNRRQAIWLRYIEGRPLADVAAVMGKSPPAVNSLVYNGLRQLRQRLERAAKFFSDAGDEPAGDAAVRSV